jgi:hypothetical protein
LRRNLPPVGGFYFSVQRVISGKVTLILDPITFFPA